MPVEVRTGFWAGASVRRSSLLSLCLFRRKTVLCGDSLCSNGDTRTARTKRRDKISEYHLHRIEDQFSALRSATDDAILKLTPFKARYDAIVALHKQIWRTRDILNDRPEECEEPHHAPMSQSHGGNRLPRATRSS